MKQLSGLLTRCSLLLVLCLWPPNPYEQTLALAECGIWGLKSCSASILSFTWFLQERRHKEKTYEDFLMKKFYFLSELEELNSP
jgi:hypothetical protein